MQVYNSRNSPSRSTPTHTTTSQIHTNLNSDNIQQRQRGAGKKQENLCLCLPISLCEALCEICLLQVEPLGTTDFLPGCCWDLIAVEKPQLFQQRRMTQRLQKIWCSICTSRVIVEAPAVFCQHRSVEKIVETAISACRYTIAAIAHPGQLQLIQQLHKSIQIWARTTSNRDTYTAGGNKKTFAPFLFTSHWKKSAFFKLSHLAPCSSCHAAAGICEQSEKFNSSSRDDWLNACRRSSAPSAPFVSPLKHLRCFVRINRSKRRWDRDKCRYIIQQVNSNLYDNFTNLTMLLDSNNFQQRHGENKKTFNHFSLRGTMWNLPSSSLANWHHAVFARPLLGSENSVQYSTLPAAANDSTLAEDLVLHLHLSCHCGSTCSVLSESIRRKDVETATSAGMSLILNTSQSYHNSTNLYKSELGQRPTETHTRPEETRKPLPRFSLLGTQRNLPSSSWATWHRGVFARPLLGSDASRKNLSFPAVSRGSTLEANLWLHLLLGCLRWSTCSVDVGKAASPGTFHLKPIRLIWLIW